MTPRRNKRTLAPQVHTGKVLPANVTGPGAQRREERVP